MDEYDPEPMVENVQKILNKFLDEKGKLRDGKMLGPDNVQEDGGDIKIYWPDVVLEDGWYNDIESADISDLLGDVDSLDSLDLNKICDFIKFEDGYYTIQDEVLTGEMINLIAEQAGNAGGSYAGMGL